jgi:hypothetical protein
LKRSLICEMRKALCRGFTVCYDLPSLIITVRMQPTTENTKPS